MKPNTFYKKVPEKISKITRAYVNFFKENPGYDCYTVTKEYLFPNLWKEFVDFWKQSGEYPEPISFLGNPDNVSFVLDYLFTLHSDLLEQITEDMINIDILKREQI